ncbi:MAG: hypothetical protein LBI54_03565 [Lachnospiraceae bacterium]|jgi:hypothetical protein|nr:hypothetical protein [Lachnospiraceae bacterium]
MTDNMQTSAIMTAGMRLLRENLGLIETEIFIVNIKNTGFDYTKWRENLWEDMTTEELFAKAAEFEQQHPELIPKNAKTI